MRVMKRLPLRRLAGFALGACVLAGPGPEARAAGPRYWDWPATRSFDEVTLADAGLDTLGGLTAGPATRVTALAGPEVAWRLAPDGNGGWYVGTGHAGEVWHVNRAGEARLVARLESTEVFSLAALPGGDLLAGCGPDGRLVRVTAAGDATEVGRIDGSYIWAIAVDARGSVAWLATGSPAAVYRYGWRDGKLERAVALAAQNTMDVALDDDGSLLAVTQGPGLVCRVATSARPVARVLGEIGQDEARRLVRGPGGAFHVLGLAEADETGGAGGGASGLGALDGSGTSTAVAALYRLGPGGEPVRVWAGDRALMTATWSPRWGWLGAGTLGDAQEDGASLLGVSAGSGATADPAAQATPRADARSVVHRLTGAWGTLPLVSWPGGDVLDIIPSGAEGFAVAQAHPAALVLAGARAGGDGATAVSPPLDGGVGVTWGRLRWEGVAGEGAPRWSVRGGRRATPDDSWTDWSEPWAEADHPLGLEACRYLQWRVELPPAPAGARAWRVTGVSVSARQPNLPPVIEEFKLERLRGLKPGDGSGDNIVHEYSSGLSAEFTLRDAPDEGWVEPDRVDPGRSVRVATWRASDPNGDRLEYRLECRREGDDAWRPVAVKGAGSPGEPLAGMLGSWDASRMEDGRYALRLVASDAPDNPGAGALTAAREVGPLVVDNTPPAVSGLAVSAAPGGLRVQFRVADAGSPIAGARLVLPDGTAERLDPADGICDTGAESFDTLVAWPRPGRAEGARPWRVRVEARDLAGNPVGVEAVAR